jgi:hypothetical protein
MTINFVNLVSLSLPQMMYDSPFADFTGCALSAASVEAILARAVISWGVSAFGLDINLSGGTSAGLCDISTQGQTDYASLVSLGQAVTLNVSACAYSNILDMPNLATLAKPISVSGTITSASFASLTHVDGDVTIEDCADLATISLPLLATIGNPDDFGLRIVNCPSLTSLSLPNLISTSVVGITINCVNLVTLSLPQMLYDCPTIDFTGCALSAASVEGVLARAVVSWDVSICNLNINLSGGTSAGLASLSAQGQADYATLIGEGNIITLNP